jgi:uncharacterized protein YecT (DUF1311 family)
MRIHSLAFVVLLVCFPFPHTFANAPDPNAPEGTTPRLLADTAAAREEAETKLEAAFQRAVAAIEASDSITRNQGKQMVVRELRESQASWQQFREKQCAFLYSYYYEEIGSLGASAAGIWEYERRMIEARIEELAEPPNFF